MTPPPECIVYYGPRMIPNESDSARWRPADDLFAKGAGDEPAVLVVDASMLERMSDLRKLPRRVVFVSADADAHTALGTRALVSIAGVNDRLARNRLLDAACMLSCARLAGVRLRRRLASHKLESREMTRIGMALMMERDHQTLLREIVDQGKRLTGSDAGAMLLAETDTRDVTRLRATFWRFDHLAEVRGDRKIALDDTTIIGHAARIGEPVVIADAHNLPDDVAFEASPEFERKYGYYIKSILIVPMLDHLDHLVGVLLFANHKTDPSARITNRKDADRHVLPYTEREVSLVRSLAGQAAVSIENARLYSQIEQILESFVKASVSAIDLRDPTTAGHSLRVSALTTEIATAVERCARGRYRDVCFTPVQMRELRFAALLHDFGKITVHEDVLVKAKKLPPVLWERVSARFELIRRTMELEYYKQRASPRCLNEDEKVASACLEEELTARLQQLEHIWTVVRNANQPAVLPAEPAAELSDIATLTFRRGDGSVAPYLTADELHFLQLPRGTLDEAERAEIESHAEETYRFLVNIPWTDDLGSLVTFASSHHEKLDGSGYPRRLKGAEIPVQVRMMTIADIFDALTASDRPYKPAVPADKALDIIRAEATAGRLDPDLVDITIESQVYRRILEEDWRQL